MTTELDIYNKALGLAGGRITLSSTAATNEAARACALFYDQVVDSVLGEAQWNIGLSAEVLTLTKQMPGTPGGGAAPTAWTSALPMPYWNYEYAYPATCARPMYVIPQGVYVNLVTQAQTSGLRPIFKDSAVPFKLARANSGVGLTRVILTNAEDAILVFIKTISEAEWPAELVLAIAARLAFYISTPIAGDKGLAQGNWQLSQRLIDDAKLGNATQDFDVQDVPTDWIEARASDGWPTPRPWET